MLMHYSYASCVEGEGGEGAGIAAAEACLLSEEEPGGVGPCSLPLGQLTCALAVHDCFHSCR